MRPSTRPRATLRAGLGLTGAVGVDGGRTTETLTGLADFSETRSSSLTVWANCLPTASAMAAACLGSASLTMTSMRTVSRGTAAEICLPSLSASVSSPRSSMTGFSTVGVVMMSE